MFDYNYIFDILSLLLQYYLKNLFFLPFTLLTTGTVPVLIADDQTITIEITPILSFVRAFLPIEFINNITPLDGVYFPTELVPGQYEDELFNLTGTSTIKLALLIIKEFIVALFTIGINKYKSDGTSNFEGLQLYHKVFLHNTVDDIKHPSNSYLPTDYKPFGVYDGVKNLEMMLIYNPLFAMSMNYNPSSGRITIDPYARDDAGNLSRYARITESFHDDVYRVTAEIDYSTGSLKVINLKAYLGKQQQSPDKEMTVDNKGRLLTDSDKAYMLMLTLYYHCAMLHAIIHLLFNLLTSSLSRATLHFPDLHPWAKQYNQNVNAKFQEVLLLLYSPDGFFNTTSLSFFSGFPAGPNSVILNNATLLMKEIGMITTANDFVYKFLFKNFPCSELDRIGICTQFREQISLVTEFANDLDTTLKISSNYDSAQTIFAQITATTGPNGVKSITTIRQFIEVLSAAGILHGSIFGATRLVMTMPSLTLFNPVKHYVTLKDFNAAVTLACFVIGSPDDYSVFSSRLSYKNVSYDVIKILKIYESKSEALKTAFYQKIVRGDPDFLQNFGFIIADHFPRQYTLSTSKSKRCSTDCACTL